DAGFLLFRRENTLLAQHFDTKRLEVVGEPVSVGDQGLNFLFFPAFSASANGVLIYSAGSANLKSQPTWFDRQGTVVGTFGSPDAYGCLAISPDSTRVATCIVDWQKFTLDISVFEVSRGVFNRITFNARGSAFGPVWSPDGSHIAFNQTHGGPNDLYQKSASGAGEEELLYKSSQVKWPNSWSHDKQYLLYEVASEKTKRDLWFLPMEGERKPRPFLQTEF